jgi:hypothetical protein
MKPVSIEISWLHDLADRESSRPRAARFNFAVTPWFRGGQCLFSSLFIAFFHVAASFEIREVLFGCFVFPG